VIHTARGRNRPLREIWEVTGCDLELKQKRRPGGGKDKEEGGRKRRGKMIYKIFVKKFPQKY